MWRIQITKLKSREIKCTCYYNSNNVLNAVLFTAEVPNEIVLLCMDYDVILRLKKN